MKNSLIITQNSDLFVGTWDLAQGFGVSHKSLLNRIIKYKKMFDEFGFVVSQIPRMTGKKGQQINEFLLTEEQATFLTTLLRNSAVVLKFKVHLTKEFFRVRKILNNLLTQKQNAEWIEKRLSGKIDRRVETDAIKSFIEYAISQGADPKGARHYYENISKMENKALFNLELIKIEYKNFRDIVSGLGLDALKMADRIVAKSLKDGMEKRMYYKDMYQWAKARVESFADSMGKLPIETPVIMAIS